MAEEISVKIVIIGEPAAGKTTLRKSFVGSEMKGSFLMTLGVDIANSKIQINDNLVLDAQLWDIAGQESWGPITKQFLQGAQGAVVVFDLTRDYTFDKVDEWLKKLHAENPKMGNNIPFIIVGNKEDLEGFIKMTDDVVYNYLEFTNRHHVYATTDAEYIRTSAKTGHRVKEAFHRMGEIIVENFRQQELEQGGSRFKDLLGSSVQSEKDLLDKQFVKVEEEEEEPVQQAYAPRKLTVQEMIQQREAKRAGRDPTKPFHKQEEQAQPATQVRSTEPAPEKQVEQTPVQQPAVQSEERVKQPEKEEPRKPFNPAMAYIQQSRTRAHTPEPMKREPSPTPAPVQRETTSAPEPMKREPTPTPQPVVTSQPKEEPSEDDSLNKILESNVIDEVEAKPDAERKAPSPMRSMMAPEPTVSKKKKDDEDTEN